MITLVDLLFSGGKGLDLSFLKKLLDNSDKCGFTFPEIPEVNDFQKVIEVFQTYPYADFTIRNKDIVLGDDSIAGAFINLTLFNGELQLLFFFDIMQLKGIDLKERLGRLKGAANEYKNLFGFDNVSCRMDNGDADENYFNNLDFGPLYFQINE